MTEDMRANELRARRAVLGCAWLFLALPGVFGIVALIGSGFTSTVGWVLSVIYVLGTIILLTLFVLAPRMRLSERSSGKGIFGMSRL